jgi:hypothetical protein
MLISYLYNVVQWSRPGYTPRWGLTSTARNLDLNAFIENLSSSPHMHRRFLTPAAFLDSFLLEKVKEAILSKAKRVKDKHFY